MLFWFWFCVCMCLREKETEREREKGMSTSDLDVQGRRREKGDKYHGDLGGASFLRVHFTGILLVLTYGAFEWLWVLLVLWPNR